MRPEPEIEIVLNGKPHRLPSDQSLADLIAERSLPPSGRGVAVALDGDVVAMTAWTSTRLRAGQRVEILVAAQGG